MKLQYSQKMKQANRLCPENVYHEKYVKLPIKNKTDKLKVWTKASICKNVVAIKIWNTLVLKDVVVMKSDTF